MYGNAPLIFVPLYCKIEHKQSVEKKNLAAITGNIFSGAAHLIHGDKISGSLVGAFLADPFSKIIIIVPDLIKKARKL